MILANSESPAISSGHGLPRVVVRHLLVPVAAVFMLAMIPEPSRGDATGADSSIPARSNRITVAVLPFEDGTGDPNQAHWRYVAAGLLKNQLGDVDAILVSSEGAVRYALRRLGLSAGDALDPNLARAAGEHIEIHRVVWGRYQSAEGLWRLDVRVLNVATGEMAGSFSAVAGDWFDLRDTLNEQILRALDIAPTEQVRRKMAERWTSSAEALEWYGKAYMAQEQGRPATELEACFRKALAADPNCAYVCAALAGTLANQGQLGPAEDLARRALKLDAEHAFSHALLGFIVANQGRLDEAKAAFKQACRLDPDDADHVAHLAQVYRLEGKWDEATALLERAVALDPTNAEAHAALAHIHAIRNDEQAALHELREAAYFMPERVAALNVHLRAAQTYERLGKTSEALEHHTRIVALATKLGMDPEAVRATEGHIKRLESLHRPTFIDAEMPKQYSEQVLDAILAARLTETERRLVGNPFSCTEPMRRWAQQLTRDATTDIEKARAIFDGLALRPRPRGDFKSRTARQVFAVWDDPEVRLVCMDHAVLFVALARAVDVNAFFTQVTRHPDRTAMNHACAAIFDGDQALLADSILRWFGAPHEEFAILDDLQTAAFLCFNNRAGGANFLEVCRAGVKLWPDSVQAKLHLVSTLLQASQGDEARRALSEISEPEREGYEASIYWTTQSMLAEADGDVERAEECVRKALAMCSKQAGAHFQLGRVCLQRGRLAEARAAFRDCLRNNPNAMVASMARQLIARITERIDLDVSRGTVPLEAVLP
jgi:tetratricopeptide (TPR) repeat protein